MCELIYRYKACISVVSKAISVKNKHNKKTLTRALTYGSFITALTDLEHPEKNRPVRVATCKVFSAFVCTNSPVSLLNMHSLSNFPK